jgi:hypothetical protein
MDVALCGGQSGSAECGSEVKSEPAGAAAPVARALNRLPFLGPVFAAGWPLDDPVGPRNLLKKSSKAG